MQQRTGLPVTNETALADLYQRHVITLLSYIRRFVPTREDAEDVLVEVFLAAYEQRILVAFSQDEQVAWLRRVAHNKCVDLLRRQQRHPTLALESVRGCSTSQRSSPPNGLPCVPKSIPCCATIWQNCPRNNRPSSI